MVHQLLGRIMCKFAHMLYSFTDSVKYIVIMTAEMFLSLEQVYWTKMYCEVFSDF